MGNGAVRSLVYGLGAAVAVVGAELLIIGLAFSTAGYSEGGFEVAGILGIGLMGFGLLVGYWSLDVDSPQATA